MKSRATPDHTEDSRMSKVLTALLVAVLLSIAPRVARAEGDKAPMSEAEFIAIAGAEKPEPKNEGNDGSRPHEPAEGTKDDATDDQDADEDDSAGTGDDGDDDADEKPAKKGKKDEAPDDDQDAEDDGTGDDAADDDEGDDADDAEEVSAEEAAFQAALEEDGVTLKVEDLPKEAQPLVKKTLKDMAAGFTRKTQELAEGLKEVRQFRAEERFRKEHTADFIVAMLRDKPGLADEVNGIIEDTEGNATAIAGHQAVVEKKRRTAAEAEAKATDDAEEKGKRVDRIIHVGRVAARAAGVPFDMGVEEGIAAHLAIHGEITEAEIRKIAQSKAAIYQRQLRQDKREKSGKYAKDKVADRKRAGLKVKPNRGVAALPGGKKLPKTDQEFIEEFTART